jgi:anti-anti-sigma regulatory factor
VTSVLSQPVPAGIRGATETQSVQLDSASAWKRDVDLELWVQRDGSQVVIRLEGRVDGRTVQSVVRVVTEQLAQGDRLFVVDIGPTCAVDLAGRNRLVELRQVVAAADGELSVKGASSAN